jgi:hypothetical protein
MADEAGKQRNPSAEAQEPIRSRAGLSLEGMASNPSRVVGKCLPQLALIGVYPMAIVLSTIKHMKNWNSPADRQNAIVAIASAVGSLESTEQRSICSIVSCGHPYHRLV